jgi:hypothetical protein
MKSQGDSSTRFSRHALADRLRHNWRVAAATSGDREGCHRRRVVKEFTIYRLSHMPDATPRARSHRPRPGLGRGVARGMVNRDT